MTSIPEDTDTISIPASEYSKDLPPLEIPQEIGHLAENVSEDGFQFDEPSSALASRVLSAHDNPSPPPSPLVQADPSLFAEQRSVSPIQTIPHIHTILKDGEGNRDDALDMEEVEHSLVLESEPVTEVLATGIMLANEQTESSGSDRDISLPPVETVTLEELAIESTVRTLLDEVVEPTLPHVVEEEFVVQANPVSNYEDKAQVPQQDELPVEQTSNEVESPAKTPRRSTRPRRSLIPFTFSATSTPIATPPSNSRSKGGKGKERATFMEIIPPAFPELPQKEANQEKKQRRKDRSSMSQDGAEQQLRSLSPGSSALLTQLIPDADSLNPFDDHPNSPPPAVEPSTLMEDSNTVPDAPNVDVKDTPNDNSGALSLETPKRLPIRPIPPTGNVDVKQSPSPRRVPLNQATSGVRKVVKAQSTASTAAKGLFASQVPLPTLNQPSQRSPTRIGATSPIRSPKKPSVPPPTSRSAIKTPGEPIDPQPRSSPAPEESTTSTLPFPIQASKPLPPKTKSRVPIPTNVVRQAPSRIPRIGNKPYSRPTKAEASKIPTRLPSPIKKTPQQDIPEAPPIATLPPHVPSNHTPPEASVSKRKRETQATESQLSKRKKLSEDDKTTNDSTPKVAISDHIELRSPSPTPPDSETPSSQSSSIPDDPLETHLPPIEAFHPSPSSPPSQPRRTSRLRKGLPGPTTVPPLNPPSRRKPPAVRNEPETFAGMTISAFRQLTTANTVKNQEYLLTTLETEIVKVEGNRPDSPTTKVRTALQKTKEEADTQRSARAQRRARRSGEYISGDEDELPSAPTTPSKHARGPGDEDDYKTPERNSKRVKFTDGSGETTEMEERRVRWDRGLSTVTYLDEVHPNGKARSDFAIKKGCFTPKSKATIEQLDALGNLPKIDTPLEELEELVPQSIVVKKFVYEDDVIPPALVPAPTPAKATRSKSKGK